MVDPELVAVALAERGFWMHGPVPDGELLRVEIRRACRRRGVRVRTGMGTQGQIWACTPDGLPGEEPWRGAAQHANDSGILDEMAADTLERTWLSRD